MYVPAALRPRLARAEPGVAPHYVPAAVEYLTVFSPSLTQRLGAEDPARLVQQILYYTGGAHAVKQTDMVRQVALGHALVDFAASMQRDAAAADEPRTLAVGATTRRLYLVEVAPSLWLHAVGGPTYAVCARCAVDRRRRTRDRGATGRRVDAGAAPRRVGRMASTLRAQLTQLEYGAPHHLLHTHGRERLEQCLERYFAKWVPQWDVDGHTAPALRASPPTDVPAGLVAETQPCKFAVLTQSSPSTQAA